MKHPLSCICRWIGSIVGIGGILLFLWLTFFTAESGWLWLLIGLAVAPMLWTLSAIPERLIRLEDWVHQMQTKSSEQEK